MSLVRADAAINQRALHTGVEAASSGALLALELGRAEAIGALCRIMCSLRSHELLLKQYTARFFLCLHIALKSAEVPPRHPTAFHACTQGNAHNLKIRIWYKGVEKGNINNVKNKIKY